MGEYFEAYEGTVVNTGWPIDGHRVVFALWDYDKRSCWHLHTWDDEADEAMMYTMFQFVCEDDMDEFIRVWKYGIFDQVYCPGPFCIELDKLVNVEKVEP